MRFNLGKVLGWSISAAVALLFVSTLIFYSGSKLYYLIFSFGFLGFLFTAIRKPLSFSYLFLAILMFLGFWLKFSLHTLLNYPYLSYIGNFEFNPAALDQVLLLATIGCMGIVTAHNVLSKLPFMKPTTKADKLNKVYVPNFYKKHRIFISSGLIVTVIAVAIYNLYAGIFQLGLIPRTYLIWPFNALIAFMTGIGFALMVSTLLWWEIAYKNKANSLFIFALTEPLVNSISILSRGLYLFHFVPVLLAFIWNKTQLKIKNLSILAVIALSIGGFIISMAAVAELRNKNYSAQPQIAIQHNAILSGINTTKLLALERWVGVEGVMAIASYPLKSMSMLKQGLLEKPNANKVSLFQYAAKSHYRDMDTNKYVFAEIPGAIAFFYYSGSYVIVFFGLFVVTALMLFGEQLVARLTNNVYIIALFSMDAANAIAQFGLIPILLIKHYLFIISYCVILYTLAPRNVGWALAQHDAA